MDDVDVAVLGTGAAGLVAAAAGVEDSRDAGLAYLDSLSHGLETRT